MEIQLVKLGKGMRPFLPSQQYVDLMDQLVDFFETAQQSGADLEQLQCNYTYVHCLHR